MSSFALPVAALTFCAWAVYMAGLASLQANCSDETVGWHRMIVVVDVPCSKVYRFWWFVMSWEFVIIAALAVAAATRKLAASRQAIIGLFAIGTLLYIDASNTFLNAQSVAYFTEKQPLNRIRTVTAGAIMTALMNSIAILVVGITDDAPAHHAADKAAPASV